MSSFHASLSEVPMIVHQPTNSHPGGEHWPSESEENLQIQLGPDDFYRRKSSMTPNMAPNSSSQRAQNGIGDTGCIVHSYLEEHKNLSVRHEEDEAVEKSKLGHFAQENTVDKDPNGEDQAKHESRLLTKKQISDMAFGIRALAKRLAHIRVKMTVRNVFILTKAHDPGLIKNSREVTEWLLSQEEGYTVWIEDKLEDSSNFNKKSLLSKDASYEKRLKFWNNELCQRRPQTFDIVLALGGDGTVLYASSLFQHIVPPVLSFSLGSLGFLTKFDFSHFDDTLTRAFSDGITVSLRLRFEATVMRSQTRRPSHTSQQHDSNSNGTDETSHPNAEEPPQPDLIEQLIGSESDDHHTHLPTTTHNILNELVIDRGPNPTMSTIELFGDDQHFTTIQADGICISTPTGSTAYNLAAGGSLCHPDNPVILVTAICAHTLSFRPIILPDTIVLRAGVPYDARTNSWASFDGRERVELEPGDYVTISASRFPFPSVLPLDKKSTDWVDSISRTLQWNSRQRQKEFK